jgi:multisubunit Na+/H+ antiporter MnhB subunit
VAVPVIVFFGCFILGIAMTTRWLPELGGGTTGGLAFFTVCGLMAAALGLVGLGIEETIRALESSSREFGRLLVANSLEVIGRDAGTVFALAMVLYVLAPRRHAPVSQDEPE